MPNKEQKTSEKGFNEKLHSATHSAAKKAGDTFENLKKQFDPQKVNAFQEKWLETPKNRKKYEKITDAPEVALNEIKDMTNDLIDYMQGEEGGRSGFLKKVHSTVGNFFKNPAQFIQQGAQKTKEDTDVVKSKVASSPKKVSKKTTAKGAKKKTTGKKTIQKQKNSSK